MNRKIDDPYHIDYIFCSNPILSKITNVEVGSSEEWLERSDHVPIWVEIE